MKTAEIPLTVMFRLKKGKPCVVLARTETGWKQVYESMSQKKAIDYLAKLWGEYLGMEI